MASCAIWHGKQEKAASSQEGKRRRMMDGRTPFWIALCSFIGASGAAVVVAQVKKRYSVQRLLARMGSTEAEIGLERFYPIQQEKARRLVVFLGLLELKLVAFAPGAGRDTIKSPPAPCGHRNHLNPP